MTCILKKKRKCSSQPRELTCNGWCSSGMQAPVRPCKVNHVQNVIGYTTPGLPLGWLRWFKKKKKKNPPAMHLGLIPGLGRFPWRREWLSTPVFLSGEFHGQRSLVGYSSWGRKELDMIELLNTQALSVPLTAGAPRTSLDVLGVEGETQGPISTNFRPISDSTISTMPLLIRLGSW